MMSVFSLILALGICVGLAWVGWRAPAKLAVHTLDQGLLALIAGLVGGRTGYVALNWDYFVAHPSEIGQVWLGGLSGVGAAYGFVIGLCLAALLGRENLGLLADRLLPLGMAVGVSAWLAAWWDGSAYGAHATGWFGLPTQDEGGLWSLRFPTQVIGAVLTLGLWAGLDGPGRGARSLPGRAAALGLAGSGLVLFGLSFTRADPTPLWRNLRLDTWTSLGVVGLGLMGWGMNELIGILKKGQL